MSEIQKPLTSSNMADLVQAFYADFIDVDQDVLFTLILLANQLDLKPLLDLACAMHNKMATFAEANVAGPS